MNQDSSNWSFHEFKVYLLLYAAYSDFELQEEELQLILKNATKEEYKHIHKKFQAASDFEHIQTILSLREKYFPNEKEADKLLQEVWTLLTIDDELSLYESNFYRNFQKLIK